jgi:hypothetical protein
VVDGDVQRLTVVLDGAAETDAHEVTDLTGQLRRQLLGLEVEAVEPVRNDDVPDGAKPLDAVSVGALVVTCTSGALRAVVMLVDKWLAHRPVRGAKLTIGDDSIELTDVSAADQQRLLQAFVDRNSSA